MPMTTFCRAIRVRQVVNTHESLAKFRSRDEVSQFNLNVVADFFILAAREQLYCSTSQSGYSLAAIRLHSDRPLLARLLQTQEVAPKEKSGGTHYVERLRRQAILLGTTPAAFHPGANIVDALILPILQGYSDHLHLRLEGCLSERREGAVGEERAGRGTSVKARCAAPLCRHDVHRGTPQGGGTSSKARSILFARSPPAAALV